jgi:integrase
MKPKLTAERLLSLTCHPDGRGRLHTFAGGLSVRAYKGAEQPGALAHKVYWVKYPKPGVKIGRCEDVSIADALKATKVIQGEIARGGNPAQERREAKRAAKRKAEDDGFTAEKLVNRWQALALVDKSARYRHDAPHTLRRVFENYLFRPAAALTKPLIVRRLDDLMEAGTPIMASRVQQYGRAAYGWAMKRGMVETNPFVGIPIAKATERERVLTDEELGRMLRQADASDTFGALVWTLIYTGQRRGEVAGMTWGELAPDLSLWTLPKERAKNHRANLIPLPEPLRRLIARRPRTGPFVFPGLNGRAFNNFHDDKTRLDGNCGVIDWTLHDLRRTTATNLQKLGVRLEVTEAILNHVGGARRGVTGIYQRHDWAAEKRVALQAWADRVQAIVEGRAAPSNVVAFNEALR